MKTVGIIAEYNPFHNGHKYLIEEAKKKTGADNIVIIMSGNFTQQGNIALMDKFKRADMAITSGADLVLELPCIYATSSAKLFAKGAITILDKLNIIDYLAFGTECIDLNILHSIAQKLINNKADIDNKIVNYKNKAISYSIIKDIVLKEYLTDEEYTELNKPNNILAIEYLINLKLLNSKIEPINIQRKNCDHNDINIDTTSHFASATSIRNLLQGNFNDNISTAKNLVPKCTLNVLSESNLVFNNDMYCLLRNKILELGKDGLKSIYSISEGLENKIYKSCLTSLDYDSFVLNIKSKRYTLATIKRILIHILLNLKNTEILNLYDTFYARIIKINNSKKSDLLSVLSKSSSIKVIASVSDNVLRNLTTNEMTMLNIDFNASNIYSLISSDTLNKDKTNKI